MKQLGLNDSGFSKHPKKTRKAQFLVEMSHRGFLEGLGVRSCILPTGNNGG